ncbi:MAG: amidohydrolase family protein, partial [Proteobacteria bacterium]|nr:amidohydrolase family protein [Pseudomonadota bacterium]
MYDLLILNGRILCGPGNLWHRGDLAIVKDRIVKIGRLVKEQARKVIDAKGCVVSPGFIDGHSHSDLYLLLDPRAEQKVLQGVTTENLGMDGMSIAPIDEKNIADWRKHLSGLTGNLKIDWKWRSLADYFDTIDALPPSINVTSYAGLGTIRFKVMGMTDREAKSEEIDQMKRIAAQAMEEGARGISSGLIYPPNQYQRFIEVIEVGRQSGIPVVITHFKVSGRKNWGLSEKALELLDDVRRDGVDISIAQYPYTAGSTMLHAVVPPWYHSKGPDELIRMLKQNRESIKRDIRERTDWENFSANNGWGNILVSSVESTRNKKYEGKNIAEIASMRNLDDPVEAAFDLLVEEELAVGMIIFHMDEKDVLRIMKHPSVSFITDGLLGGG